jgi:hypothetical protein
MTTVVDAAAAQVCSEQWILNLRPSVDYEGCNESASLMSSGIMQMLLPIFLESLQKVSRRLVPRLLVLASDAEGLQICRAKHAHCLPWFQRLNPE